MEWLSKLKFPLASLVTGSLFVVLGLVGGSPAKAIPFTLEPWARIACGIIGILLLALAAIIELGSRRATSPIPIRASIGPSHQQRMSFHTLDDEPVEALPKYFRGAQCVSIMARTGVNLLSQYEGLFEDIGKAGCKVRLLLVDPRCEVAKWVYADDPRVFSNNLKVTRAKIAQLRTRMGGQLQVRVMSVAPTMSLLVVERPNSVDDSIRVQLYFLKARIGRDRPIFHLERSDYWYEPFCSEFERLWNDALVWPTDDVL